MTTLGVVGAIAAGAAAAAIAHADSRQRVSEMEEGVRRAMRYTPRTTLAQATESRASMLERRCRRGGDLCLHTRQASCLLQDLRDKQHDRICEGSLGRGGGPREHRTSVLLTLCPISSRIL
jgi:hypothetical protein